eukprot:jgi/Botrbrau1/12050/Bobra.0295s0006.1
MAAIPELIPNASQRGTLIAIAIMMFVIAFFWFTPIVSKVLYPFKVLTVAFHEFGHAAVGICTGAKISSIELDPELGGATHMVGGIRFCTLPAGYLGSSLIGALLIFFGFDSLASKIAAALIAALLLLVLIWAKNWFARGITLLFIVIIILLYFIPGGWAIRYFVLFVGVMSAMYSIWDIMEDLVFRKVNESDAAQFAELCRCCPAQVYGIIWAIVSVAFMGGGILAGLYFFK